MKKYGGKINTIIDADPYFRLSNLKNGGEVSDALRVARSRLAYGGLPDDYMQDDRYKTFQQMGGTKTDPRSEAMGRYLPKMIAQESGGNPTLKNPRSTAAGLGQFIKGTWRKMTAGEPEIAGKTQREIDEMRRSATPEGQELQKRMMEKFTMGNADILQQKGIPLTPANLYALHFAGDKVGPRALTASDKTPVRQIFKPEAITANPFLRGMNAGQFRKWTENVIEKRPGSVTRGILPLDMDFQRSQLPSNRYEGLQTAMAGAQQQPWQVAAAPQPTPPTQMAYAKPEQRGFSADLMTPRPVPQPTQMARLPDMNVGGQRMAAQDRGPNVNEGVRTFADRGPMAGGSGPGVPDAQMAAAQPPQPDALQNQPQNTPEMERPNQDMMEGIEQPFFGLPDFDLAGLFADGGVVGDALRLATGGRTPTWQKKEGQNPEGGLSAKGRASYNRANPGKPGLKPPAPHPKTEKDAKRRKSFCARMSAMPGPAKDEKGRPTRKTLSLRAWNCADGGAIDDAMSLAKGGPIWNKPRPKRLGKPDPLTPSQKASAKAAAKAAGRPWPNMIDNLNAAKKDCD